MEPVKKSWKRVIVCRHCKKQIKFEDKIIGIRLVCPFCKKPN